jgi:hypothetical protein
MAPIRESFLFMAMASGCIENDFTIGRGKPSVSAADSSSFIPYFSASLSGGLCSISLTSNIFPGVITVHKRPVLPTEIIQSPQ